MPRVVVAGSFNVDHVWRGDALPRPGETLSGAYASGPGGKGFNQAVAAARAGAHTAFVCALGPDVGAQWARALAAQEGIALHDAVVDAPTGTAGIFVDAEGRNSIVVGPGANAALKPAFVAGQAEAIAAAAVVLAQLETPVDAMAEALRLARVHGATTVLNPAPANVIAPAAVLALTDIATPNETEFAALVAAHLGESLADDAVATLADDVLHALCRALLPGGTVVITLGAAGCFVSHGTAQRGDDAAHYRLAAPRAEAIDTTGAGDAFNGALAASLATAPAWAFRAHAAFAGRYASHSTERPGAALAMPTRLEVEARFPA